MTSDPDQFTVFCDWRSSNSKLHPFRFAHFTVKEFLFSPRLQHNRNERLHFFALTPDVVTLTTLTAMMTGALAYQHTPKRARTTDHMNPQWSRGYVALKNRELSAMVKEGLRDGALQFLRNRSDTNPEEEKVAKQLISEVSKW